MASITKEELKQYIRENPNTEAGKSVKEQYDTLYPEESIAKTEPEIVIQNKSHILAIVIFIYTLLVTILAIFLTKIGRK